LVFTKFVKLYKVRPYSDMAQRKLPLHKKSKAAGISLPPDIIREARKRAHSQGMSLSGLVRSLLIAKLSEEAA
jgi:hypothetical protein